MREPYRCPECGSYDTGDAGAATNCTTVCKTCGCTWDWEDDEQEDYKMPMPEPLFNELVEDTKTLTQSLVQYGDRWATFAGLFSDKMSDGQREVLKAVFKHFLEAVRDIGEKHE